MMSPNPHHRLPATTKTSRPAAAGWAARRWGSCLLIILLLASAGALPLEAAPRDAEQQNVLEQHKIDFLIDSVAALKGASFIRNGSTYDAAQAASHLRMKLRFAGSRVKTAQDFIVYCASKSSMSGIPYRIRFANGRDVDSEIFLRQRLTDYAAGHAPHTVPGH
jgi:NAD(P)-dependent dehydrogenase (short-subunit alcohol dehydrogenase family)